jgi:hypothetical protein
MPSGIKKEYVSLKFLVITIEIENENKESLALQRNHFSIVPTFQTPM